MKIHTSHALTKALQRKSEPQVAKKFGKERHALPSQPAGKRP